MLDRSQLCYGYIFFMIIRYLKNIIKPRGWKQSLLGFKLASRATRCVTKILILQTNIYLEITHLNIFLAKGLVIHQY